MSNQIYPNFHAYVGKDTFNATLEKVLLRLKPLHSDILASMVTLQVSTDTLGTAWDGPEDSGFEYYVITGTSKRSPSLTPTLEIGNYSYLDLYLLDPNNVRQGIHFARITNFYGPAECWVVDWVWVVNNPKAQHLVSYRHLYLPQTEEEFDSPHDPHLCQVQHYVPVGWDGNSNKPWHIDLAAQRKTL